MKIPDNLILECTRFQQVMAARSNIRAKLELFTKLKLSTKFSEAVKPYCFALLVEHVAAVIPGADLTKLYGAMASTGAADAIRQKLSQDEYEQIFGLVVRKALEHATIDPKIAQVFDDIERSGISGADAQTVSIAIFAGVEPTRIDEICNMLLDKCSRDRRSYQKPHSQSIPLAA